MAGRDGGKVMMPDPKVMPECIVEWEKPSFIDTTITAIVCCFVVAAALLMFALALGFRWCP